MLENFSGQKVLLSFAVVSEENQPVDQTGCGTRACKEYFLWDVKKLISKMDVLDQFFLGGKSYRRNRSEYWHSELKITFAAAGCRLCGILFCVELKIFKFKAKNAQSPKVCPKKTGEINFPIMRILTETFLNNKISNFFVFREVPLLFPDVQWRTRLQSYSEFISNWCTIFVIRISFVGFSL